MIEAVLDAKSTKKEASRFLVEIELAPPNDIQEVESVLRVPFDVDIEGFESLRLDDFGRRAKRV